MPNQQYGLIKKPIQRYPYIDLLFVPHKERDLIVSFPAFGPNTYTKNLESINQTYTDPRDELHISLRPATISESISVVAYGFGSYGEVDFKSVFKMLKEVAFDGPFTFQVYRNKESNEVEILKKSHMFINDVFNCANNE